MEILTGFAQLWLLCGCVGLLVLLVVEVIKGFRMDDTEATGLIELIFVGIATFFLPLLGPFVLAVSIQKLHEVIHDRGSAKDE